MLRDVKAECTLAAQNLGDYQNIDLETLLNGYCEATDTKNEFNRSNYFAAIVLRFWYKIDRFYRNCKVVHFQREDFIDWLVDAIELACQYRAWQNPEKKVNAQQALNMCTETTMLRKLYVERLQKNSINHNTVSLNLTVNPNNSKQDGEEMVFGDTLDDGTYEISEATSNVSSFIQGYIKENKIIEAIILDTIAFSNTFKCKSKLEKVKNSAGETEKKLKVTNTFSEHLTVENLNQLSPEYKSYFLDRYSIKADKLDSALAKLEAANNQKKYRYLRTTLKNLRADTELLSTLLN